MARNSRVYENVVKSIAQAINAGELPPGARLPSERDLVVQHGVSRMSVREALLTLQAMGLVEIHDRSRAQVRQFDSQTLLDPLTGAAQALLARPGGVSDFQEARIMFEGGLVRYAARHASPKEIARLGDALLANRRAIGEIEQFVVTDMAFHAVIAEIPQNGIFVALNAALSDWLANQRRVGLRARGSARQAYHHHEQVFEAIAAHSPEAAEAAMTDHLTFVAKIYREQAVELDRPD